MRYLTDRAANSEVNKVMRVDTHAPVTVRKREFIEDSSGKVSRIVKQAYYYCGFCQTTFDLDYPQIDLSPNDGRARCPYDHERLERMSANIEVG